MAFWITLHVLAAVVWVGGMFFAYQCLRPAVGEALTPEQRPALWYPTLTHFFRWVWAAVVILPVSGYVMIFRHLGGMGEAGWHVHVMQTLGIAMILLFLHVFFAPYQRLGQAVSQGDAEDGLYRIGQIRRFVGINLLLGLAVVVVGSAGRYL
jgi:uncharacterized membrane protein